MFLQLAHLQVFQIFFNNAQAQNDILHQDWPPRKTDRNPARDLGSSQTLLQSARFWCRVHDTGACSWGVLQIFTNLTKDEPPKEEEVIPVDTMEEYNEIDETNPETQDAFAAYLAEGSQKDREVPVIL